MTFKMLDFTGWWVSHTRHQHRAAPQWKVIAAITVTPEVFCCFGSCLWFLSLEMQQAVNISKPLIFGFVV